MIGSFWSEGSLLQKKLRRIQYIINRQYALEKLIGESGSAIDCYPDGALEECCSCADAERTTRCLYKITHFILSNRSLLWRSFLIFLFFYKISISFSKNRYYWIQWSYILLDETSRMGVLNILLVLTYKKYQQLENCNKIFIMKSSFQSYEMY